VKRTPLLGSALLVALVSASASAQDEHAALKDVRLIQEKVSEMRGLKFQAPVKCGVQKPEQLKKMLLKNFDEEAPAEEIEKQTKVIKVLGLLPPDYDLRASIIKFMSDQIGGFYDPEKKELFLVDRSGSGQMGGMEQKMNDQMVMAHELHHALQDQNFGLDRWFEVLGDHEDRIAGYKSLVEGEAQLVGMTYLFGKMGRGKADMKQLNRMQEMMMKMSPQGRKFAKVPPYLLENMMFPYTQGAEFVQALQRKEGWEGISRAFSDPPASTEQVLHPEKYFTQRDEPKEIMLPNGIRKILGGEKGSTELYENTLGEFNVSLILRALGVKKPAANRLVSGWDGDRFAGFETKDGRVVVVWLSTWDSEAQAKTFESAYRAALTRKGSTAHLERRGTEILWISGASAVELPLLVAKAFKSLCVEQRYAPLPGMKVKPPLSDFVPGAVAKATPVQPTQPTQPTKPAASASQTGEGGLVRLDAEGASFSLPAGFKAKDETVAELKEMTRARYQSETQELRVLELPLDIAAAKASVRRHMEERGTKVEREADFKWAGRPAVAIRALDSGKSPARTQLFAVPNGKGRSLVFALSQAATADTSGLTSTLQVLRNTLWLDSYGNDGREVASQKLIHAKHQVTVPTILPNQKAGDPEYGRIHRQADDSGASIAVSVRGTRATLAAIAKRTLRMLSMAHNGKVKIVLSGIVKQGKSQVFELEYEVGERRVRQRTLIVGGRRWTMTCSAPKAAFDGYRVRFGDALNAFQVKQAKRKEVYK
jgi:hypothetical protein